MADEGFLNEDPRFFRPLVRRSLTSGEMGRTGTGAGVWRPLTLDHPVMTDD